MFASCCVVRVVSVVPVAVELMVVMGLVWGVLGVCSMMWGPWRKSWPGLFWSRTVPVT